MGLQMVRFINSVILGAVILLTLSGVYGLFLTFPSWMFEVHRLAGWLLIAVLPWKVVISLRSLKRRIFDGGIMVFVALLAAMLTLLILVLGLAWGFRLGPEQLWLRQTAISWHWMLALALVIPFALHAWRRWSRPQKADILSRRGALRVLGLGAAAIIGWQVSQVIGEQRATPENPNRFTGSRLEGYFSGNRFPVTHSLAASRDQVDPATWQLTLTGEVMNQRSLTYDQLLSYPQAERIASLDCTLGWYTIQNWQGISLSDLLIEAGISSRAYLVRFASVTGYAHILPLVEAQQVILATHVNGETLEHQHGFPVRAVVPSRRGWFWVKWLSEIEVIGL
jgi:DMSO/TMAO reductase YedYZ molybdopterin-dependent catalytic subunit